MVCQTMCYISLKIYFIPNFINCIHNNNIPIDFGFGYLYTQSLINEMLKAQNAKFPK